jgi:hypothetical protein
VQKKMKFLFAGFLSIIAMVSEAQTDVTLAPEPSGPWAVGRRSLQWVDSSRREPTDSSRFRTLPLWVWYPAPKTKTGKALPPLPEQWAIEQAKYFDRKIGTAASQFLRDLKTWYVPDAPAARLDQKLPVLIFGPGLTWTPPDYSAFIEDIVSYGYIVVGYVPTGFAGVTQLADGKIVPGTLDVQQQNILFNDASFIKNHLYYLESGWLKDLVDIHTVGVFGHSLGGAAALVSAAKDSSVKALVDLDGDLMGTALTVKVSQPSLFLSHDERSAISMSAIRMDREGRERSEYRRLADWVRATDDSRISLRIRINDILHFNLTDLWLIPPSTMTENEKKDKIGVADGNSSLRVIAGITREFFDYCLKHAAFHTMTDLEQKYPQAQALLWKGFPYN